MKDATKKITINYVYNLSFQIFSLLVPLVTTPYISRILGAEMIGIYSYTLSISTYFIVAGSLGFPLYGQREIAYCAQDKEERSILFFQLISGQLLLLTIALTIYYIFVIFYVNQYKSVYFAQSIGIMGGVLATSWFYIGIEEFRVTVAKNFIVKILSVLGLFLLVKKPEDVVVYACIVGGANVFGNVVILLDINKYVDFKYYKVHLKNVISHVKPAFILGIPYYITSIYAIIDKTMLGMFSSGYAEVGYYEQSQKIITFVMAIVTSLGTVMMPRLAYEVGNNNLDRAKSYLSRGIEVSMLLACPISVGLATIASNMVPWFFGFGYDKVTALLIMFAPMTIIMGGSNLIGSQYMVAAKKEKELTITILIGVIINCSLNAMLIPRYDSYGAAIATIISELIKLILQICISKAISINSLLLNLIRYSFFALIMGGLITVFRESLLSEATILNTAILILIGMFIYTIELLLSKNTYVYSILITIKSKVWKNR